MALSLTRPDDPARFFESWPEYLRSWTGTGAQDVTFCRALMGNYEPLMNPHWNRLLAEIEANTSRVDRDPDLDSALEDAETDLKGVTQRVGFPWVTPVLGSGCLSAAEGPEAESIELVPAQLGALARSWGLLPDGSPVSDVLQRFADNLLAAKDIPLVSSGVGLRTVEAVPVIDRTVAARTVLCAYLLSRLYFEVGAMATALVGPTTYPLEFDTALDGPTPRGAEIDALLREPLLQQLRELKDAIQARPITDLRFVAKFAEAIRIDLTADPPRVRGSDARLMTEIAWHFLAEGTSQYPGWSDLLVLLNFEFNSTDRRHRWPHLTDLASARAALAKELRDTTELSWQSRLPPASGGPFAAVAVSHRDQLYDAVARLLIAQAKLSVADADTTVGSAPGSVSRRSDVADTLARSSHHADAYPPAVAFVTSFDLELEMALLALRSPFRLVMPFYVRRSGSNTAIGYVWLQTLVAPPPVESGLTAGQLTMLYRPTEWSLLSTHPMRKDEWPGVPAVVRLAGSPLVDGPDLATAQGAWADRLREQLGPKARLVGTVLLDEHTALQQWAADLGMPRVPNGTRDRLGLPERFVTGVNEETDARFWFLLGVQLNDDGVRHRSAALVGAADLRGGVTSKPRTLRPRRMGVMVNRRSTPDQREVFIWQGLDVVAATYDDVLPALIHIAEHAEQPDLRRVTGTACALPENLA